MWHNKESIDYDTKWQDKSGYWHFIKEDTDITNQIKCMHMYYNDWAYLDPSGEIFLIYKERKRYKNKISLAPYLNTLLYSSWRE